jgi:hypothetical protein
MLRRALPPDIAQIVDLAVEAVSREPWPVRISRPAMTAMASEVIGSNEHFCWVSDRDGRITAAVGALTQDGWWHERKTCSVLMFYSRAPGDGIGLLREFARWVKSRPAIKVALFSLEHNADPRIGLLLRRLGFTWNFPQYGFIRGLDKSHASANGVYI